MRLAAAWCCGGASKAEQQGPAGDGGGCRVSAARQRLAANRQKRRVDDPGGREHFAACAARAKLTTTASAWCSYSCCYSVPGVVWPRNCTHLLASVSENSSSTSTVQLCASRSCTHASGNTAPSCQLSPHDRSREGLATAPNCWLATPAWTRGTIMLHMAACRLIPSGPLARQALKNSYLLDWLLLYLSR